MTDSTRLGFLRAGWLQVAEQDLLQHVGDQAAHDDDDDGEPGRAAGQQLHKDEVHVLRVQEGPVGERGKGGGGSLRVTPL